MQQLGRSPYLLKEALQGGAVADEFRVEHLERHQAFHDPVFRLVDGTHAARAEQLQHAVARMIRQRGWYLAGRRGCCPVADRRCIDRRARRVRILRRLPRDRSIGRMGDRRKRVLIGRPYELAALRASGQMFGNRSGFLGGKTSGSIGRQAISWRVQGLGLAHRLRPLTAGKWQRLREKVQDNMRMTLRQ
jgi:hypothetical protein